LLGGSPAQHGGNLRVISVAKSKIQNTIRPLKKLNHKN
jgi:hypothetical protein